METNFDVVRANAFIGADMPFQGKRYFVKPRTGLDGNSGRSPRTALKTLAAALAKCVTKRNDVVYLIAEGNAISDTTDYQATALDWNKDMVHLIGVGCNPFIGQRARISNLASATAIVNGLLIVSGHNCLIQNILVIQEQGGTNPTGASIAVSVTGQRNHFVNCQISGIAHSELDDATSRSLKISGSENMFSHCYLGLDTIIRATAQAEVEVADGVARTVFEDCMFSTYTSAAGFLTLKYSAPDRFILLKNCVFNAVQNITSAVAPNAALSAATSVNGQIIVHGSAFFGYGNVTAADDAKVLIASYPTAGVDAALAAGVDVAA